MPRMRPAPALTNAWVVPVWAEFANRDTDRASRIAMGTFANRTENMRGGPLAEPGPGGGHDQAGERERAQRVQDDGGGHAEQQDEEHRGQAEQQQRRDQRRHQPEAFVEGVAADAGEQPHGRGEVGGGGGRR